MESAFKAIGLDVSTENAFTALAEEVGARGEVSVLDRAGGVLHARCLKLGAGLEVWTRFYQTNLGEVLLRSCRPAFRARRALRIMPWQMSEADCGATAMVQGFVLGTDVEVKFQLQNRTELLPFVLEDYSLSVGLCGLAYNARISQTELPPNWFSYDKSETELTAAENDWGITGRIVRFEELRNRESSADLFWIVVETSDFSLEVIVNRNVLSGVPRIGATIVADVWLQGHVVVGVRRRNTYEGPDTSVSGADHWQRFRRLN